MIFMYIDESGKNMITQKSINTYFIGGLNIESKEVFSALDNFKIKYQEAREKLKKQYKKNTPKDERLKRMNAAFSNFELHAVEMFNPKRNNQRKRVYKENPWQYSNNQEIIKFVNELLRDINPYIKDVYIFKVDKQDLLDYCKESGITPTDTLLDDYMVEFVVKSFNHILVSSDKKGSILPDKLDSRIRDQFVKEIRSIESKNLWSEPIVLDSASNAFTQLVDIITYCYYLVYTGKCDDPTKDLKAVKSTYEKYIKGFVNEKNLIDYLKNQEKSLTNS